MVMLKLQLETLSYFKFPVCQNQQDNQDGPELHHKSPVICTNLQFTTNKQALPLINQTAACVIPKTYAEVAFPICTL